MSLYPYRFFILGLMFLIHVGTTWPGVFAIDAQSQYNEAIAFQFTDHHPPLMAFVWHYLDKIYPGPGLMYLFQLILLYASLFFLIKTAELYSSILKKPWIFFLVLVVPLIPCVFSYSILLVKDIHFTFSFLLVLSILAFYTAAQKKISIGATIAIGVVLIYGIAVKYQGWYCGIVPVFWMGRCLTGRYNDRRRFFQDWQSLLASLIFGCCVYGSVHWINQALVPAASKSHAWQYVKLFDLAAISIEANQDLIPSFNKTPAYTTEKLKWRFQPDAVDPYIYSDDNIFKKTSDDGEMDALWNAWAKAVVDHPFLYLKHRGRNMGHTLMSRVGFDKIITEIQKIIPQHSPFYAIIHGTVAGLSYIFLSHLLYVLVGIFYWFLAIFSWNKTPAAPVLFGFSSVGLLLLAILFFMSMAGTPRYTYMTIVMVNASHLFAYMCWQARGRHNILQWRQRV